MNSSQIYPVEVQGDFLSKQTYAKPAHALAELIWNSLDADADLVEVMEIDTGIDDQRIVVTDNGLGFSRTDAPQLFGQLGGSWKHLAGHTKRKNRFLHGSEGKGRFKAFALGRVVDWEVCFNDGDELKQFSVSMVQDALREVRVTDAVSVQRSGTGVRCVVSELHRAFEFLRSETTVQTLSELFAAYLKNYTDVQIRLPAGQLDISAAIAASQVTPLRPIVDAGVESKVELEIIEWKHSTERLVYLCNEAGFPLSQVDCRVHAPGLNFSAYIKSPYISRLSREGTLGLAEMNPLLTDVLTQVRDAIKAFHRQHDAEQAQEIVERWKDEKVYPYSNEPQNVVERIEREVFDVVAVKVNSLLPELEDAPQKSKKLQLRMLRQAIEKSPEDLQLILTEVLELPERKRQEFARLLQETSLTAIISASKVVSDRLKFMTGLEALLFDSELKRTLKERTQLHRLLAENTWIFGEEFFLSVDDESLTEVLRKHLRLKGIDVPVNDAVRRVDGRAGIIDLMLTRGIPCHRENELEHLIVELKRPTVNIGSKELSQIKSYAFAVAKDERFLGINTRWTFWVISNDMDDEAKQEAHQSNRPSGMIHESEDKRVTIWAKTWSEILQANRQRMKLFQQSLEVNANREGSLAFLRETYATILKTGDAVEELELEKTDVSA